MADSATIPMDVSCKEHLPTGFGNTSPQMEAHHQPTYSHMGFVHPVFLLWVLKPMMRTHTSLPGPSPPMVMICEVKRYNIRMR